MSDEPVGAGYDAVATTYDAQFADELDHKPLERGLLDAFCGLSPNGTIADIGCGPGHITRFLAERREDGIGMDLSLGMVTIARGNNPRLRFAVASMLRLPVRDAAWAGVVALYSIIHLNPVERGQAFAEFARTLAPDGLLLVSFHVDGPGFAPGEVNHLHTFLGHPVDMGGYFLDPSVVTTDLVANGFRVQARLDRELIAGIEFASRRCYILARRAVPSSHGPRA
jgi:SAM-dependent methyltransferase